jgi:DNA-binding LytR/AlgR family response regulator
LKFKCIIVEDEPISLGILEKYCSKNSGVELCGSFSSAKDALEFLRTHTIDLVFLDVIMPDINGFEFLDQLEIMPSIILTTSKTEFAYTAFQYHVSDYLKKPFSFQRFNEAVSKLKGVIDTTEKKDNVIFIKSKGKYQKLKSTNILYVESMGDYVKYVTTDNSYIAHSTLKASEEKLDAAIFTKIHRCYIVNINKITNYKDNAVFIDNHELSVSKTYKTDLLTKLRIQI